MSSVLWKYIRLICLFSFFLCLFPNCNSNKKNKMVEQNISSLLNQDVDRLKGVQILSLDSVVGETEKCVIVYIFNYYDCETCIDKGFEIVNLIDNSKKREYVKVIVSMFHEVTSTQKRNSYRGFIYKDKNDLIRKELRYIPTPVMIIVDNNSRIRDACIFEISQDKKQLDDFIKKCLSIDD